jgi:hypothetical protein
MLDLTTEQQIAISSGEPVPLYAVNPFHAAFRS